MIIKSYWVIYFVVFGYVSLFSQNADTILQQHLQGITVKGYKFPFQDTKPLESVHNGYITSGKKSEVIFLQELPANITEKTGRQIFAKVPGAFIYDMDGSGNQMNIATRGMDPHRSWELNVRQNGVITNSDIYGYPASHYSPPMEAIQKIEIFRGTASLMYGSQFGGMVNYITKKADTTKILSGEVIQSAGSFGLLSTYLSIGGKKNKWTYFGYYHKRKSEGYRTNAASDADAQFFSIQYDFSKKFNIKGELGRSSYLFRSPGPLTDRMFEQDPRQATRSRNYFSPDIYVPSLILTWDLFPKLSLSWTNSAVYGDRNSIQFIGLANVRDTISATTLQYANRQVDIDNFNSFTSEIKARYDYKLGKIKNTLITGITLFNNDLHRRQQGKGSTGSDYDLTVSEHRFNRNIHFKTKNVAFFAENLFTILPQLEMSLGARLERGESNMSGVISYLTPEKVPNSIQYHFPLFGASIKYQVNNTTALYCSGSQAYRPVIFADLIPATVLERSDPDLKNAFGYNVEIGIKGKTFSRLTYDVNYFIVQYNNRIGNQVLTDDTGKQYALKTNIGNSVTHGAEILIDVKMAETDDYFISLFTSTSYFKGYYTEGLIRNGSDNLDLTNKTLEGLPEWISRNGLQMAYKKFSSVILYSYVAQSFSDPLNTVSPDPSGARGIIPSYRILDINFSYKLFSNLLLRFGVNNVLDEQYFTKRPTNYPGQGIWNSDGRGFIVSVGLKF